MYMKQIVSTTKPFRQENLLTQAAGGKIVLCTLDSGNYYCLDEVGSRVWELCDGARSIARIATILAEEFDSSEENILRDIIDLLAELANENLVGAD
jgi:hypothetical protein